MLESMMLFKTESHFLVATKRIFLSLLSLLVLLPAVANAAATKVEVQKDANGYKLQVDNEDFMVLGMNWGYMPIGQNYNYSLWTQSDEFIKSALQSEMSLLVGMGVNTIRQYVGIPARWVEYIYETYGIYTVLNHPLGRYGLTLNGVWVPSTDYSDPQTRQVLLDEMEDLVEEFNDVPGLLMWLLGNENNYGLVWKSAETEAIPEEERGSLRARYMYSLFGDVVKQIKTQSPDALVSMANGDLQYLDIIADEVKGLDVFGSNVYRGISARDAFQRVHDELGLPLLFTEFGCDAFNAKHQQEDQEMQARFLIGQWQEIYEQSYGKGRVGNAVGGLTFQFSDGWWKYLQTENLDVHDTNASWPNGGYEDDFVEGNNNMNEEWWGICAKGRPSSSGKYDLYPRAAYYALQEANSLDPYGAQTDLHAIKAHFATIDPKTAALRGRGDKALLLAESNEKARFKGFRLEFETINTGGKNIETPDDAVVGSRAIPGFRGFDHMESYYADFEIQPSPNLHGTLTLNMVGHVPENTIDEIYYENRGLQSTVATPDGTRELNGIERLKIYKAGFSWEDDWFRLNGFYRTGHYHWEYEGDFFGLYREANYGPNLDTYNGEAPAGFELEGKRLINGLNLAWGPQLWWGANPTVIAKYQHNLGPVTATVVYQEDLDEQGSASNSSAVPLPPTRKATLHLASQRGPLGVEAGLIWSGENKVGELFQIATESGDSYLITQDRIKSTDALGGKFKVTFSKGRWNWYMQGALMGLVADAGATQVQTYTGWHLKDSGKGNQVNLITGVSVGLGDFQIAPNVLFQKPIEGPIPMDAPAPSRPRNVLDDPFAVRENRETIAGEVLFTYDPTPGTWMYAWNSDMIEDAKFASSVGLIFRHHPTTQDGSIFIAADGTTRYRFAGAPPARDLWEGYARIVSKQRPGLGLVANLYGGQAEPNGVDERLVYRYGADMRLLIDSFKIVLTTKMNDWGPYDYHRDHNLTYPLQLITDVSKTVGTPTWWDLPQSRFGFSINWRSLNEYSNRYLPSQDGENGNEWEVRTYVHFGG
jgi:beta-galactosidase